MITNTHYKSNGHTGLRNLGNTCFLNSCIQILSNTHELHSLLYKPGFTSKMNVTKNDTIIFREYKELTEIMWSGNGEVDPRKFVMAVHQVASQKGIEIFTGWAQNDVTEFLRFIVNCFHNSVARPVIVNINGTPKSNMDRLAVQCFTMLQESYKKEYSELIEMFYGIMVSELKSVTNGTIHSLKPEQYFILDLPIPTTTTQITLTDCFREFVKEELMTGDSAWFNEKTGQKEDVKKRMRFWNFPKILVVTLKRFDVAYNRISKNGVLVNFPLSDLDLSSLAEDYESNKYVYDLYGVSNHIGGVNGGHYTAFVKRKTGDWVHFNDSHVTPIADPAQIITPMAYCLFYRMV